jgi:SAM-dependent methyltransferase
MHDVVMIASFDDRQTFLAERRAMMVKRYDTIHSPHYDEHWATVTPSHATCLRRFLDRLSAGAEVLDAACGTGKYWATVLNAGLKVVGLDQSSGMLAQARRKHPTVPTQLLSLQNLGSIPALHRRFQGLVCIDALECIPPEDWPGVAVGLAQVLKQGSPAYVTVELHAGPLPGPVDPRQVPGEVIEDGGYHFYTSRASVSRWLEEAGFVLEDQAVGDDYWHLILARN